ncbi:hypothetical protein [Janibacter terrae]|uniref:hypothetical protein n=1 Tax=Janibacter terrae TaxID=103817 RepID=UPI0031F99119
MTGRPRSSKRIRRAETEFTSFASTPGVRSRMQVQRTRDTAPEMALRSSLHSMGLRYRVDRAPLPGLRRRADIVFGPARVAVFVDGCFWHGCPEHGTKRGPTPTSGRPRSSGTAHGTPTRMPGSPRPAGQSSASGSTHRLRRPQTEWPQPWQ